MKRWVQLILLLLAALTAFGSSGLVSPFAPEAAYTAYCGAVEWLESAAAGLLRWQRSIRSGDPAGAVSAHGVRSANTVASAETAGSIAARSGRKSGCKGSTEHNCGRRDGPSAVCAHEGRFRAARWTDTPRRRRRRLPAGDWSGRQHVKRQVYSTSSQSIYLCSLRGIHSHGTDASGTNRNGVDSAKRN